MSISEEFLSRHSIQVSDEPEYAPVDQYTGSSTLRRANPYLNPRQLEFWEQQRTHQEYLNYLHFKHRLEGKPLPQGSYDDEDEDDEVVEIESKQSQEEIDLQNELIRQKELLEKTKIKIGREVDKFKAMLDDFRMKRERQKLLLTQEYSKRKERYAQDISTIKESYNRKPDIKINIREVSASELSANDNYTKGGKSVTKSKQTITSISRNTTKSTTELSMSSSGSIYDD